MSGINEGFEDMRGAGEYEAEEFVAQEVRGSIGDFLQNTQEGMETISLLKGISLWTFIPEFGAEN